jgi:hypothetical protein
MNEIAILWISWGLTGFFSIFLLIASAAPKLIQHKVAVDGMNELGWDPRYLITIGVIEAGCVILHLIPQTSVLGLLLLTALLGGAIATKLRANAPMFGHVLFGVYVGVAMWGGLWMRSPEIRALLPLQLG